MRVHIFHRWSKWEQYIEHGTTFYTGILVHEDIAKQRIPYIEKRQKRTCEICGKMQDEKIV